MRWYLLKHTSLKIMWGLALLLVLVLSACSQQVEEPSPEIAAHNGSASFTIYPGNVTAYLTVKGEGRTFYSVVREDELSLPPGRYTVTEGEGYTSYPNSVIYKLSTPGPSFSVVAGRKSSVTVYMRPDCSHLLSCSPYTRSDQE